MTKTTLRPYQQDAINSILNEPIGSKLILALAVGLGKTYTSAQLAVQLEERLGRPIKVAFIARQRQLVFQPLQYFPGKKVGMEMGKHVGSLDDDVIVATAQSFHSRLAKYPKDHFDLAIFDECFTGDVEILTENGFIRFDELGDEKVAQVHYNNVNHFSKSFVQPIRKIKKDYKGIGVKFDDITMTENHNQVLFNTNEMCFYDSKAIDANIENIVCIDSIVSKKIIVDLDETVYCVTVPTGKIIVRKNDVEIISGNCQEIAGKQYSDILHHFTPSYSVGLSGTPFRLDGKKLTDGFFDKIVYQRNIKWGIENDFLCDVEAVRCHIGYDLSNVKTSGGDYNIMDLEAAMVDTERAIAEAYNTYSKGRPTLIFATGVAHAWAITNLIDGAEVIVGDTKQEERDRIFNGFQNKEIPCIVSVQVMTQGVDLPISTVGIFAKPTKSVGRYQQQVGRILRKHPDKDKALIVDCIGSSNLGLCTAPSIIGIDITKIPEKKQDELEGDLMDMVDLAEELSDVPQSWIRNAKIVDIWAKDNKYQTNKVDYFQMPDGRMVVTLPERAKIILPPPDMLGNVDATEIKGLAADYHQWGLNKYGDTWEYQRALNAVRAYLERNYQESAMLWDKNKIGSWGRKEATEPQMKIINRKFKDEDLGDLTRYEAAQIIKRIKTK